METTTLTPLTNGKYVAEMRMYKGTKRRINIFQGKASIYTMQGHYLMDMHADEVQEHYTNIKQPPKPLYNLVWMVSGDIKEYVLQNVSYALAKHQKNILSKQKRYANGLLMPVQSNLS